MASQEKSAIKDEVVAFKKRRILEEAMTLFYEYGYRETSVDNLAERLNVTKPFIYSYFPGKAEILYEICRPSVELTLRAATEVAQSEEPPTEKLRRLVSRFVVIVCENQESIALFQRNQKSLLQEHSDLIMTKRKAFDMILENILSAGKEAGEFDIRDVPIASLAVSGMVNWTHTWYNPEGSMTPFQLGDRIADLALAAACAKP